MSLNVNFPPEQNLDNLHKQTPLHQFRKELKRREMIGDKFFNYI